MRCSRADQQLQLYLDKRLTIEQMRSLEAHVAICPTCQNTLYWLETIERDLRSIDMVPEPPNLTSAIMQRVALAPRRQREVDYGLLRPSLHEFLVMIVLSTIVTLGVILGQPSLRATLPIANGHDVFSQILLAMTHLFINVNSGMLMWIFWIVGTLLGVWITLALAGEEVRTEWLKAMMDHLPVW
jgi:predicted anti-sigma-YlaC factor YlaD